MNNLSGSYSVPSTSAELEKLDSLTPLSISCKTLMILSSLK